MKKTGRITLTVVAAVAMTACSRRGPDPCQSTTFNEQACQQAVQSGGYYWNGSWVHMGYGRPYTYYYDSYRTYVSKGGTVSAEPGKSYGRPAGASPVERGGFGGIGSGHGSGSGE
jgi:hypothetical protein